MFYEMASGRATLGGVEYAPELGVEFVGYEVVPFLGTIDTSTEWLRLVGKKPDWIYVFAYGATLVTLVKDAARLDIQKRGVKLCGTLASVDEVVLGIVGEDGEGWHVMQTFPSSVEKELPQMKTIYQAVREYRGWENPTGTYIISWLQAMVTVQGVRLAIETAGFENLTGRLVRDSLASIKDFDTGLVPPISISDREPYYGGNVFRLYHIRQGKISPVGDWVKPVYHLQELG